jgi:hypothetical protein
MGRRQAFAGTFAIREAILEVLGGFRHAEDYGVGTL